MAADSSRPLRRVQPGLRPWHQVRPLHAWGQVRVDPDVVAKPCQMGVHAHPGAGISRGQADGSPQESERMGLNSFYPRFKSSNYLKDCLTIGNKNRFRIRWKMARILNYKNQHYIWQFSSRYHRVIKKLFSSKKKKSKRQVTRILLLIKITLVASRCLEAGWAWVGKTYFQSIWANRAKSYLFVEHCSLYQSIVVVKSILTNAK